MYKTCTNDNVKTGRDKPQPGRQCSQNTHRAKDSNPGHLTPKSSAIQTGQRPTRLSIRFTNEKIRVPVSAWEDANSMNQRNGNCIPRYHPHFLEGLHVELTRRRSPHTQLRGGTARGAAVGSNLLRKLHTHTCPAPQPPHSQGSDRVSLQRPVHRVRPPGKGQPRWGPLSGTQGGCRLGSLHGGGGRSQAGHCGQTLPRHPRGRAVVLKQGHLAMPGRYCHSWEEPGVLLDSPPRANATRAGPRRQRQPRGETPMRCQVTPSEKTGR